jgi:hypothetical protein
MRITIEGDKLSIGDLKRLGKVFVELFSNRGDLIKLFVAKGTEHLSAQECSKILSEMFDGDAHSTRIFYINKMGETNEHHGEKRR